MAFQVTANTVISDDKKLTSTNFGVNNDNGVIEIADMSPMVGTVAGYASGGFAPGPTIYSVIDKFPFATDTNATNIGSLTQARFSAAGQSSTIF